MAFIDYNNLEEELWTSKKKSNMDIIFLIHDKNKYCNTEILYCYYA